MVETEAAGFVARCDWASGPWLTPYHDLEWGVAIRDDRQHFELLSLEGAQAGLSWLTVLKRREGYRQAFSGFDPMAIVQFDADAITALMAEPGIIRNRRKIESVVTNAAALIAIQEVQGSFDSYIWSFVDGHPVINRWTSQDQVPSTSELAMAVSSDLRRRGFAFVGPTVCYAYLQSAGIVVDHLMGCFRHAELSSGQRHRA